MKIIGFILFLTGNIVSAQTAWKIEASDIRFKAKNAGLTVNGTLSGFNGEVNFDAKTFAQSSIKGSVEITTIKTGIAARDKHLQKEEYFNQAAFPKIELVSSFFGKTDTGFKGYFKLTMKGVTKDIVIPFTWKEQGKIAVASGSFAINRLDFGVGASSLILNNDIYVNIQLNLVKP